jgi:hypothetical protein
MNEIIAVTLSEYLAASKLCLNYAKDDSWGGGACLGFPAALLLFSVVDALGSYVQGSGETFPIEGKRRKIRRSDFEHFFVLNGESYYQQQLNHAEIKHLYDKYRSLLSHHAIVVPGGFLLTSGDAGLFPQMNGSLGVNLTAFHNASITVVRSFLESHSELGASQAARNILRSAASLQP